MTIAIIILSILLLACFIAIFYVIKKWMEARDQATMLSAELNTAKQVWEDRQAMLDQTEDSLKSTFSELSHQALKQSQEDFLVLASTKLGAQHKSANQELDARKQAISSMLEPVAQSLQLMGNRLNEMEKNRSASFGALNEQIRHINQTHINLQKETTKLSQALHHQSARGRWGELQLQRVVELSGMTEHCDFTTQDHHQDDDSIIRPDMVIKLPQNRSIVVDAKAPMTAYLSSLETSDPEQQLTCLVKHAKQVKEHIQKLSLKAYFKQFKQSPEFVVMFLPGESIFQAALQGDPSLIELGANQKVIIATPSTLIALLKTVAYGWQQESIAENAHKISQAGAAVYDSCAILTEHFNKLGKSLNQAVTLFNKAGSSLRGNLTSRAQTLQKLGVTGKKTLPDDPAQIDLLAHTDE